MMLRLPILAREVARAAALIAVFRSSWHGVATKRRTFAFYPALEKPSSTAAV